MTRPYSWFPLAASDPVPGDPGVVRRAGERYEAVAETISDAADALRDIADLGHTVSRAVDEVRTKATEVAAEIIEARQRYRTVGDALRTYAEELAAAQAESVSALSAAQSAQSAVDQAGTQVAVATRLVDDAVDPEQRQSYQRRLAWARRSLGEADAALARARGELQAAVDRRDAAAVRAIAAIEGATGADGLNDGAWLNWGSKLVTAISSIAGTIAAVAGVLALVLAWVPVVGQALAVVAMVAGAVALIADFVLWRKGEKTGADVAWGVLGVASFGIGRIAGLAAKAARSSVRSTAVSRATTVAKRSGNPAVRAEPGGLLPARLQSNATTGGSGLRGWAAQTRVAWGQVRSTRGMDRVHTVLGHGDLVADVNALRSATHLTKASDLAARSFDHARSANQTLVWGSGLSAASNAYATGTAVRWLVDEAGPDHDPLRLTDPVESDPLVDLGALTVGTDG